MKKILALTVALPLLAAPSIAAAGEGWTGFYAGADIGRTNVSASLPGSSRSTSADGTTYGVHAGYNYAMAQKFVAGAELAFSKGNLTGSFLNVDQKTTRLKLKGGYDAGPALVYGVLGYAKFSDGVDTGNGYTLGLGASYKATEHVLIGAEYLYDNLSITGVDVKANTFSLNVGYQF